MSFNDFYSPDMYIGCLELMIETLPASVYCKDRQGKYLHVNKLFIRTTDLALESSILGKTDQDMMWQNQALPMMKNDQHIMKNALTQTFIEKADSFDGTMRHFLSHKMPLRNKSNDVIGIFGISFVVGLEKSTYDILDNMGVALPPHHSSHNLTPRQSQCLYHLARGMTIKQIAKQIRLSPKTVEHYLEAVKVKLECSSRFELIQKAISFGLLN